MLKKTTSREARAMKVLVCMDSSIYADEILNEIAHRPWPGDTQFKLVTAVEATGRWDYDQQNLNQAAQILNQRVNLLKSRLKGHDLQGEVIEGGAHQKINEFATEWNADLVLIGSHGDTGIRKSSIGSVAASVVNDAPCSVEVIKLRNKLEENKSKAIAATAT
ncbi:MAG: universal stress protein [Candidatus Obscuribacterales bacterium]|nr:universal stress protein [Candidatus Obscuribacterales bacterium]